MNKLIILQLSEKENDKYPTASIRDINGTLITTLSLPHVSSGLYQTHYDLSAGDYSVVYNVYSDSGHLNIDTDYDSAISETISVSDESDVSSILSLVTEILKLTKNDQRLRTDNNTLVIYDDDGVTPLVTYELFDRNGSPAYNGVFYRRVQ